MGNPYLINEWLWPLVAAKKKSLESHSDRDHPQIHGTPSNTFIIMYAQYFRWHRLISNNIPPPPKPLPPCEFSTNGVEISGDWLSDLRRYDCDNSARSWNEMHAIAHTNTRQHKEDILSSDDFLHQIQFGAVICCTINVGRVLQPKVGASFVPLFDVCACVSVCDIKCRMWGEKEGWCDSSTTYDRRIYKHINSTGVCSC